MIPEAQESPRRSRLPRTPSLAMGNAIVVDSLNRAVCASSPWQACSSQQSGKRCHSAGLTSMHRCIEVRRSARLLPRATEIQPFRTYELVFRVCRAIAAYIRRYTNFLAQEATNCCGSSVLERTCCQTSSRTNCVIRSLPSCCDVSPPGPGRGRRSGTEILALVRRRSPQIAPDVSSDCPRARVACCVNSPVSTSDIG